MGCCVTIPQSTAGVLQRWGRFLEVLPPGLHFIAPCCGTSLAARISLRVQELDVDCETKTHDNVFVNIRISVQYQVMRDKIFDAHYKLSSPEQQIRAYVFDVVRSSVPKIKLDDVFTTKEELAIEVKGQLESVLNGYGFRILQTLVVDIAPDSKVKDAMNQINAAVRHRVAATDKAEAEKILVVKAAEADAQSKYLSGTGIARQRKAIVDGLRDSVLEFSDVVEGTNPKDVMDLVLITQYFDTLKDLGQAAHCNTVFVPHTGSQNSSIASQVAEGFISSQAATSSRHR
eukprot:CAMPEP_0201544874 /NCGR_PEP_ID=MMETSP0173_2-20130828/1494_1 /ASSEMBLY_ACC=CAM_ASM_000268 /TAXON_ID=218659 /ORGANISM="Vexillifera sp., Strain DIVA3 564/2" /LENGTH=287 /DNA_ID=CAMNT_0047953147 /DNA_START=77 /DNA_END=940 /DNA_ORIENTATION=-